MPEATNQSLSRMMRLPLLRRLASLPRPVWIQLGVFIGCYGLFMALLRPAQQASTPASSGQFQAAVQHAVAAIKPFAQSVTAVMQPTQASKASIAAASTLPSSPHPADTAMPSGVTMPNGISPQRHFEALNETAHFDEEPQNRLNAIAGLRQLATAGDPKGEILESLRAATMDGDAAVAQVAQQAYNEVLKNSKHTADSN